MEVLQLHRTLKSSPRPGFSGKRCNGAWGTVLLRPTALSPGGSQCPRWAGSPLTAGLLSPQVLAALLMLTAVVELVLAFVDDTEQDPLPAVYYTNPSLFIATWVRDQPVHVLCVTREMGCETAVPSSRKLPIAQRWAWKPCP